MPQPTCPQFLNTAQQHVALQQQYIASSASWCSALIDQYASGDVDMLCAAQAGHKSQRRCHNAASCTHWTTPMNIHTYGQRQTMRRAVCRNCRLVECAGIATVVHTSCNYALVDLVQLQLRIRNDVAMQAVVSKLVSCAGSPTPGARLAVDEYATLPQLLCVCTICNTFAACCL